MKTKCESGAVLIEAAFAIPIMLALLALVIDFSVALIRYENAQAIASAAARIAAIDTNVGTCGNLSISCSAPTDSRFCLASEHGKTMLKMASMDLNEWAITPSITTRVLGGVSVDLIGVEIAPTKSTSYCLMCVYSVVSSRLSFGPVSATHSLVSRSKVSGSCS